MRLIIAAFVFMAGLAAAQAQGIQGADVTAAGIYKLTGTKEIKDPTISTGRRTESTPTLVQRTTNIPAKADTVFGVDVHFVGRPAGQTFPLHIVWRYPEPGLRNPDTGATKFSDEYDETRKLDEKTTYYWSLGPDWTLVPGEWVIELWSGNKLLAKQTFQLQR